MDAATRAELKRLVSEEQKRRYIKDLRFLAREERWWDHQRRLKLALGTPDDPDSATIRT